MSDNQATTVEALSGGSWTIFAPTDDAFDALALDDDELVDALLNCTSALNSVLSFHTVFGNEVLFNTDLVCGEEIAMANGDLSRTVCRDGNIYQKGGQNNPRDNNDNNNNANTNMPMIIAADVEACNGVVHIVDKVMLPKETFIAFDDNCDGYTAPPGPVVVEDEEGDIVVEERVPTACQSISK